MNQNYKFSQKEKDIIKNQFNELHGIYTKTIVNGKITSYIARCECKNNSDYITIVHYITKDNLQNDNDKYMAMSLCMKKGDRYLKKVIKTQENIPTGYVIAEINSWNGIRIDTIPFYVYHIKEYEKNFINRVNKYYKKDKNILMFYV